jgi:hypothetical protein
MGFCCDDRVFMCDTRQFGTVSRTGLLGLKKSGAYAITSDSGKRTMYVGAPTSNIVCCKTSTNHCGSKFLLPLDLKSIGSSILEEEGVPPMKRSKLYADFSKISDEDHEGYRRSYSAVSSSAEKTRAFVMDIYNKFS